MTYEIKCTKHCKDSSFWAGNIVDLLSCRRAQRAIPDAPSINCDWRAVTRRCGKGAVGTRRPSYSRSECACFLAKRTLCKAKSYLLRRGFSGFLKV
jgi:hypothetical protein